MQPLIFILIDGLSASEGAPCMGYLHALHEAGQAAYGVQHCVLPAQSRPVYASLFTGLEPAEHGIVSNQQKKCLPTGHLFDRVRNAGGISCAAAHFWVHELCIGAYSPAQNRFSNEPEAAIQHGIFYHDDTYPDSHVLLDAEYLRRSWKPDFLFVHTMNVDDAGHRFGGQSPQYRHAARAMDALLAEQLPQWIAAGYQIIISSDHGMNADGWHNGLQDAEREIPIWLIGDAFELDSPQMPEQLDLYDTMCAILES